MRKIVMFVSFVLFCQTSMAEQSSIEKPFIDIFRKLIKKVKVLPFRSKAKLPINPGPAPAPVIPPLQMSVLGISGEQGNRVAIVTFEGKQRLLMDGDEEAGKYRVISIEPDKISLMHLKAERRQEINFK